MPSAGSPGACSRPLQHASWSAATLISTARWSWAQQPAILPAARGGPGLARLVPGLCRTSTFLPPPTNTVGCSAEHHYTFGSLVAVRHSETLALAVSVVGVQRVRGTGAQRSSSAPRWSAAYFLLFLLLQRKPPGHRILPSEPQAQRAACAAARKLQAGRQRQRPAGLLARLVPTNRTHASAWPCAACFRPAPRWLGPVIVYERNTGARQESGAIWFPPSGMRPARP